MYFEYSGGDFILHIDASMEFFGLGSISIAGTFTSDGRYDLSFAGDIGIGVRGFFGIFGTLTFHIEGNGSTIIDASGSIGGDAYLVGIHFWRECHHRLGRPARQADTGRLQASISISIDFWLFSVTFTGNFNLGYR